MNNVITFFGFLFVIVGCVGIAIGQRMAGEHSIERHNEAAATAQDVIDANTTAPIYVPLNTRFAVRNETGARQYFTVEVQHEDQTTWRVYHLPHGETSEPILSGHRGCRVQVSAASPALRVVKL